MLSRRGFLQGLVSLPLIGGGVALIGKAAMPVPLIDVAAAPILGNPRERARYAWQAFASAMREVTADAEGWRVVGGECRPLGPYGGHELWLRTDKVRLVPLGNGVVDRMREVEI